MTQQIGEELLRRASCRAGLLIATTGFRSDYWQDFRQELVLDCLRRSPKFDPARGEWSAFVTGVMRNHSTVLFGRTKRRQTWEFLADDVPNRKAKRGEDHAGVLESLQKPKDYTGTLQLRIDVQRVLRKLPADLQTLAALMSEVPVREIPLRIGKSRSRFYQLRRELQRAFQQAGYGARWRVA